MSHTPTPWKVHEPTGMEIIPGRTIKATNKAETPIAIVLMGNGASPKGQAAQEANAALIVRAVNSHADLLAACQLVLSGLLESFGEPATYTKDTQSPDARGAGCDAGDGEPHKAWVDTLRAAIAYAAGKADATNAHADLLEVVEVLLGVAERGIAHPSDSPGVDRVFSSARAAIAKAKGEA